MEFFEYESIKDRVRRLRKDMTESEQRVWSLVKGKQMMGFKFRRQHPITVDHDLRGHRTYFIIDFYCPELKFGIEVDNLYAIDQKLRGAIAGRFEEIAARECGLHSTDT